MARMLTEDDQLDPYYSQMLGAPYTNANAPAPLAPGGFQQPASTVPAWQVATGAGAAPVGSFLPDWRAGQPDQAGATDASGTPYAPVAAAGPAQEPAPTTPQPPPQPAQALTSSGGGGGADGGGTGGGITSPTLYAPFTGEAPTYQAPTLPNAPSFDDFYTAPPTPTFDYTAPPTPTFDYTAPPTPTYNAPTAKTVDPFAYASFQAPTIQDAESQPGYQFGVQQGEQALQQSRAAQGTLRTGGTLKDILDYGRNAATQNYSNVFNQNLSQYATNRGNALDAYNTNYQTQVKDPNDLAVQNAQSQFTDQLAANTLGLNTANTKFQDTLAANQFGLNTANTKFQDTLAANQFGLTQAQAQFAPKMTQYQTDAANAQRQAELGYNADWQKYLDSENVFYANENAPFAKYLSLAQLGAANA